MRCPKIRATNLSRRYAGQLAEICDRPRYSSTLVLVTWPLSQLLNS
jgi:hypothetical protein